MRRRNSYDVHEAKTTRVIVAGGGTGGHLFPGIAVSQELRQRGVDVLFVATENRLTLDALNRYGLPVRTIKAEGIKGHSPIQVIRALAIVPSAIFDSIAILRSFRPQLTLGVGGYVSGPVTIGAWLMRMKTAIQEQNSVPGLTNRILGRFVSSVFIAFPESEGYFPARKTVLTGNPVRQELLNSMLKEHERGQLFTVLVLGGSQGAHRLNELMTESLAELRDMGGMLSFVHQTGKQDEDWVRSAYEGLGFKARVSAFINDMGSAYSEADLVVCRAGAGTLAELTALGKPSLLVPYPYAANNHQEGNARSLEKDGAAKVLIQADLTPSGLAAEIKALYNDRNLLEGMVSSALKRGKARAASLIADECLRMIQEGKLDAD
ncbi:MAG: undecaprenyldiphospho-muramoylpentapeptide beta-N-acetylglucosaminyltransferase [Pseudomonadota bacterium]